MKKSSKIWLIAATVLLLLGLGIMTWALVLVDWDFTALDTEPVDTNTHEIGEKIQSISMETGTADIVFVPSEDGACRVVCHERENLRHSVDVRGDVLEIRETANYDLEGIDFDIRLCDSPNEMRALIEEKNKIAGHSAEDQRLRMCTKHSG